jgi:outer membrane biosynthesis protein TonB
MRTTLVGVFCLAMVGAAWGEEKKGAMGSLTEANQKLDACAATLHKSGTAQIHLKLAKDGTTSDVKVTGTGSADLDACVAKAVSTTKFPRGIEFTLDVRMKIPTGATTSSNKPPGAPADPDSASGTELDRAMISAAIAKVKANVVACGDKSKVGGTVKATVKVTPAGKATATATGSTDAALNTCVAKAIDAATFDKTTNGGTFTYPFVFDTPAANKPAGPPGAAPPLAGSNIELDRAAISEGIASVRAKVVACGDKSKAGGTVKATVQVGADGKVTSVTASASTNDPPLRTCVEGAMKTATFKKTTSGGSFTYPFVFDTKSTPASPPPASGDGSALDRSMISDGITKVKSAIAACGDGKMKGVVKVKVVVAPAGTVSSSTVTQTPDEALGTCVAGVIAKATFAKTGQGGTFTYPFVF